jgi:4-aminobutyrate aminotransferase
MAAIDVRYDAPEIRVAPPGPMARAVIAKSAAVMSPSCHTEFPLVMERGEGVWVWDVDGNRFLDLFAGIAVSAAGHNHPAVVAAVRAQVEKFLHAGGADVNYAVMTDLAEALARLGPGKGRKRVLFTNSGTESVEAAIKLARYHTARPAVIAFYGAFHGRTAGSLALTASRSRYRRHMGPFMAEVYHTPFGDPDGVQRLLEHVVHPDDVAAIVVEPIQGEGGYRFSPDGFLAALRSIADHDGILLIADEVQSGVGRTGRMWAVQHWGVVPDILVTSKGLAAGIPLGAVIAPEEIMTWPPGSHGSTAAGNPVACAAALAILGLVEGGLVDHAARAGKVLLDGVRALAVRYPMLQNPRGLGLMVGVDVVDAEGRASPTRRNALVQEFFQAGLLTLGAGNATLRFSPPLVISEHEIGAALRVLDNVLGHHEG